MERYFSVPCCVAYRESLALNYESFSLSFCSPSRDFCPEMQYFNKANFVHNNTLFVVKTALHNIELKCKKRKGLNRHKFLFCHFGNFCFMFVWLRVSSYFLGPFVLSQSFIIFFFFLSYFCFLFLVVCYIFLLCYLNIPFFFFFSHFLSFFFCDFHFFFVV